MKDVVGSAKILVCVGTGGVGKTTLAASLGVLHAEQGKRVLVLTIDPAKRLKTILGLSDAGMNQIVQDPRFRGSLSAALVDSKKTFDDFVLRAAKHSEAAKKLLRNKLYVQLSTTLSGSQEFTALERLYSEHESRKFDLIILDTPPSQHAIDFLRAPQKLSALFQEGVVRWFRDPEKGSGHFFSNLLQTGTKQVLRALEMLTGSEFMRELSEFFNTIQGWQSKLEDRTSKVHELLISPETHFLLVSSYDRAKMLEAREFGREIRKNGYHLRAMILNRAFPTWLSKLTDQEIAESKAGPLALRWRAYFRRRRQNATVLTDLKKQNIAVFELPEMSEDIHNLNGLFELVEHLKEAQ